MQCKAEFGHTSPAVKGIDDRVGVLAEASGEDNNVVPLRHRCQEMVHVGPLVHVELRKLRAVSWKRGASETWSWGWESVSRRAGPTHRETSQRTQSLE